MNIKNLSPQERDVLEFIIEADGQIITGHALAEKFEWKLNHADMLLLSLAKAGWLDRRRVPQGRHSHYEYWPREDEQG